MYSNEPRNPTGQRDLNGPRDLNSVREVSADTDVKYDQESGPTPVIDFRKEYDEIKKMTSWDARYGKGHQKQMWEMDERLGEKDTYLSELRHKIEIKNEVIIDNSKTIAGLSVKNQELDEHVQRKSRENFHLSSRMEYFFAMYKSALKRIVELEDIVNKVLGKAHNLECENKGLIEDLEVLQKCKELKKLSIEEISKAQDLVDKKKAKQEKKK